MKTSKFKMTEVGPIPEEWECHKIGDLANVCTGNRNTQDKNDNGLYPFYVRSQIVERIDEYGFDTEGVITVGDGVGTGKVFHYVNGKFALHQRCYLIDSFDCQLNAKYFYKIFSERFWDRVMQMTAKSSVDSVRREMITEMVIPVPPLPEQERIAEALSDVDALLSAMTTLIEKKRAIKQGTMQELLGMRNAECGMRNVPRRRLAGFSGEWVEKRLGEIASFETATIGIDKIDSEWYIGTENMLAEKAGVEKNLTPVPYATVREYKVGDVLISNIRPYLKKIWSADRDGGCSTDVLVVRTIDKGICLPMFLKMLLSDDSFFDFTMANAVGTKMPRGDKKVIMNYEVHLPSLAEQQAIAAVLSDMDAEIAALEAKRAKYESIKLGMMQELLTGRTRLKGE